MQPALSFRDGMFYVGLPPGSRKIAAEADLARCTFKAEWLPPPLVWWGSKNPYAALPFAEYADDAARAALGPLLHDWVLSKAQDAIDEYPAPPGLSYMPFQRAGIQFALTRRHALIGDQMGLGKTVQALGVANAIGARRILIVCPASIRRQWLKMARLWLIDGPNRYIRVLESGKDRISPSTEIVITSYHLTTELLDNEELHERGWELLILDEAHYCKTMDTNRTVAVLGRTWEKDLSRSLASRSEKILALTGTPLPNRPRELFTLARVLDWDAIDRMGFDPFCMRYNPQFRTADGTPFERVMFPLELGARLRRFMVRRLKDEVLHELPPKSYEIIEVPENAEIRTALKAESLLGIDPERIVAGERLRPEEQAAVLATRRIMGLAKVSRIVEHVKMLLDGGAGKLVLFCWHLDVIAKLGAALTEHGIRLVTLTGASSPSARSNAIAAFVEDPEVAVFLAQIQAGGVGVDGLQSVCSLAVFGEPSWSFADIEQATDRLHRHGQRNNVTVQFLVADTSLDQRVLTTALRKGKTAHAILDRRL